MPAHSVVLSCGIQNDTPFIWCLVDTEKEPTIKAVNVFMTGDTIDDRTLKYCYFVGSVINSQGLVAPIFAEKLIPSF